MFDFKNKNDLIKAQFVKNIETKLEGGYISLIGVNVIKFNYIKKKLPSLLDSDLPTKKFFLATTNEDIFRFMLLCGFNNHE